MVWKLRPGNSPQQKGGPTSYQPWLFVPFSASGPAQQATQCFSPVACPCICRTCGDKAPLVNTELCLPSTLVLDEGITTSFFPLQTRYPELCPRLKPKGVQPTPSLLSSLLCSLLLRFRKGSEKLPSQEQPRGQGPVGPAWGRFYSHSFPGMVSNRESLPFTLASAWGLIQSGLRSRCNALSFPLVYPVSGCLSRTGSKSVHG